MRMKLISAMAITTLWAGAAHAVSVDDNAYPYVGGNLMYEFPDSSRDSDNGEGFGVYFGWPLAAYGYEKWAAELTFHTLRRERNIDGKKDYQTGMMLDLVYDLGTYGWGAGESAYGQFKPFLIGGLGVVQDDVRGNKGEYFGVNLGAGALIPLNFYDLAARLEGRVLGQSNDESVADEDFLIDYRISLGLQMPLSFLFTESTPVVEAPSETCELAVVDPVTGRSDCGTDTDRDGVLDSLDQCPATPEGVAVDGFGCPVDVNTDEDGDGVPNDIDLCPETQLGVQVDATGCVITQSLVLHGVNFENASAVLTVEATAILDDAAASLRNQSNVRVAISGHTDNVGNDVYNQALSEERAESVRQYLISQGVEGLRLEAAGYGESQPIASNDTPEGRAENRRVEFNLIVE